MQNSPPDPGPGTAAGFSLALRRGDLRRPRGRQTLGMGRTVSLVGPGRQAWATPQSSLPGRQLP